MRFGAGIELQPGRSPESAATAAAAATATTCVWLTQTSTARASASAPATPAQAAALAATITNATPATAATVVTASSSATTAATVAFAAATTTFAFVDAAGAALPTSQCLGQQSRHGCSVDRRLLCEPNSIHVRKPGRGCIRCVEAAPQDCNGSPTDRCHSSNAHGRARRTRPVWPKARR